jgi:hypothetical protein
MYTSDHCEHFLESYSITNVCYEYIVVLLLCIWPFGTCQAVYPHDAPHVCLPYLVEPSYVKDAQPTHLCVNFEPHSQHVTVEKPTESVGFCDVKAQVFSGHKVGGGVT